MATQILQVDCAAASEVVRLRDDVQAVLVVLTDGGRPVDLVRLPRPAAGVLDTGDLTGRAPAGADSGLRAEAAPAGCAVSVVVCTHERPDDLERCLASLRDVPSAGHEVIVVDNRPLTGRTEAVARHFGCRYVVEPRAGLDRARNKGWHAAVHDIVAFADDDVVVSPGWVTAIGACFADPAVGCATGLVLPLELETRGQEEFELYCQHRRGLRRLVYSSGTLPASAAGVVGMGANMAFRRALLADLGGFDVRLDAGTSTRSGGDTDMFARVLDAGRLIVYTPDALVWHRHRRSMREVRSCVFGYGVGLSGALTKRIVEERDAGALVTAVRWMVGPVAKAARARLAHRRSPRWGVVLAETAGMFLGPLCYAYETWRNRVRRRTTSSGRGAAPRRRRPVRGRRS